MKVELDERRVDGRQSLGSSYLREETFEGEIMAYGLRETSKFAHRKSYLAEFSHKCALNPKTRHFAGKEDDDHEIHRISTRHFRRCPTDFSYEHDLGA